MILLYLTCFALAFADNWPQGSFNDEGTRNPNDEFLTIKNVGNLTEEWFHQTPGFVVGQTVVVEDWYYYSDGTTKFYANNVTTGENIWNLTIGGIMTGGPTIYGDDIVGCTALGSAVCFRLNRYNGSVVWLNVMQYPVWASVLKVGNQIIVGLNPGEESIVTKTYLDNSCCTQIGSVMSLDFDTGATNWQWFPFGPAGVTNVTIPRANIFDGPGSNTTFKFGPAGGSTWGHFSYSRQLDLIFGCNGQASAPDSNGNQPLGTDSCFALRPDGTQKWLTPARPNYRDIYNNAMLWNPQDPIDLDIGNGPVIYTLAGPGYHGKPKTVIFSADKYGWGIVFDGNTGQILHTTPTLNPNVLPHSTSSGGFNVQSTSCKVGGRWVNYGGLLTSYNTQQCSTAGGLLSDCLKLDYNQTRVGYIIGIKDDGSEELYRFGRNNSLFLGGLVCSNGMIFARDAMRKSIVILKAKGLSLIHEVDLSNRLSGYDFGGHLCLSNGDLYVPTGVPTGLGVSVPHGIIKLSLPRSMRDTCRDDEDNDN